MTDATEAAKRIIEADAMAHGYDSSEHAIIVAQAYLVQTEVLTAAKIVCNEIPELFERIEKAEAECLEQARLNGMGSEREAALLSKLAQDEAAVAELAGVLEDVRDNVVKKYGLTHFEVLIDTVLAKHKKVAQ